MISTTALRQFPLPLLRFVVYGLIAVYSAPIVLCQTTNVVNPTGNVGVGTTTPAASLEVRRAGGVSPALLRLSTAFPGGTAVDLNPFITGVNNGGFELTVAGARRMVIDPSGNIGMGTLTPGYALDINGAVRTAGGVLNTTNYFEKILPPVVFPNLAANKAVDIRLGNSSIWGYIEVEITSTFAYQNSVGKLTKVFAIGTNANNTIYTNESRVSDAMGTIPDNISIGDIGWDSVSTTYKIQISHIVPTQNSYTIKVRMFSDASTATSVFNALSVSSVYTSEALARNYVYFNGNVGIGTANPTQKLSVNGTIRAKEVIVETAGWSDYVFARDYKLLPLSELEQQIKVDGRLPGLPSAAEVTEHGVGVGEMQAKLLAKIEELTLYVISQDKRIRTLEAENARFKGE